MPKPKNRRVQSAAVLSCQGPARFLAVIPSVDTKPDSTTLWRRAAMECVQLRVKQIDERSPEFEAGLQMGYLLGCAITKANSRRPIKARNNALASGRAKRTRGAKEQQRKILAAAKEMLSRNDHLSATEARRLVAIKMGISFSTVRSATPGLESPRKKLRK